MIQILVTDNPKSRVYSAWIIGERVSRKCSSILLELTIPMKAGSCMILVSVMFFIFYNLSSESFEARNQFLNFHGQQGARLALLQSI